MKVGRLPFWIHLSKFLSFKLSFTTKICYLVSLSTSHMRMILETNPTRHTTNIIFKVICDVHSKNQTNLLLYTIESLLRLWILLKQIKAKYLINRKYYYPNNTKYKLSAKQVLDRNYSHLTILIQNISSYVSTYIMFITNTLSL